MILVNPTSDNTCLLASIQVDSMSNFPQGAEHHLAGPREVPAAAQGHLAAPVRRHAATVRRQGNSGLHGLRRGHQAQLPVFAGMEKYQCQKSCYQTYLLTYAHHSQWSIGHQRPPAIAICSGLLLSVVIKDRCYLPFFFFFFFFFFN